MITALFVKFLILIQESRPKTKYLKEQYEDLSPEDTEGIFNDLFIWWINPLIAKGYRKLLSTDELPNMDSHLHSERNRNKLQNAWDSRCLSNLQF